MFVAAVALVVGATGVAGASGSGDGSARDGAPHGSRAIAPDSGRAGVPADNQAEASVSARSAGKLKKAKRKALKRCRSKADRARRKSCVRRVTRRYAALKPDRPAGETFTIDVRDKYFNPDAVEINVGDSLLWYWNPVNHDAHNVNLVSGPRGVDRLGFGTPSSPSVDFKFKRTFTVPGTYRFACSIHQLMTMTVEVSK